MLILIVYSHCILKCVTDNFMQVYIIHKTYKCVNFYILPTRPHELSGIETCRVHFCMLWCT